jgi:hypothetical protein
MNMNLENLFYMVKEHLENTQEYHRVRLECWEKQNGDLRKIGMSPRNCTLYVDHSKDKDAVNFAKAYERSERGERVISDFCDVLGIDRDKLYGIVKGIIKWHDKRDWLVCFPFTDKNNKTILEYIKA